MVQSDKVRLKLTSTTRTASCVSAVALCVIGNPRRTDAAIQEGKGGRATDAYGDGSLDDGPKGKPRRIWSVLITSPSANLHNSQSCKRYADKAGPEERNDGYLLAPGNLEIPDQSDR